MIDFAGVDAKRVDSGTAAAIAPASSAGSSLRWPNIYPVVLIVQAWVAMLVITDPLGNFPVVDDWAYLKSVKALVEHGALVYSDWTAPNLISQVIWGALFGFPLGVSYVSLRFSTEVLAVAGAAALYWTLRETRCPTRIAVLGALLFLINPLVCILSASFMSDVPYAAMQIVAVFWLLRGIKSGSQSKLRLGWVVAVLALLCRQVGMAIPIGFGAAKLARSHFAARSIAFAVAPFAGFLAIQWLFQTGLSAGGVAPANFGHQIDLIASNLRAAGIVTLAGNLLLLGVDCIRFLGVSLLPLSLLIIAQSMRTVPKPVAILTWFWLIVAALLAAGLEPPMRTWTNMAWTVVGPDVAGAPLPSAFWPVVSMISAFGGITFVLVVALTTIGLFQNLRDETVFPALFAIVTAAALFASMALLPRDKQYDRYLLPLIPCFIVFLSTRFGMGIAVAQPIPQWAAIASNATLAAVATWSLFGTHDYLAEKRVQWAALQDLVQNDHVPPETIDAGWVYNASTSFGVYGNPNRTETWFRTQNYLVASNMLPNLANPRGFTTLREYPVTRWAPWNWAPANIVVLRRNQLRP